MRLPLSFVALSLYVILTTNGAVALAQHPSAAGIATTDYAPLNAPSLHTSSWLDPQPTPCPASAAVPTPVCGPSADCAQDLAFCNPPLSAPCDFSNQWGPIIGPNSNCCCATRPGSRWYAAAMGLYLDRNEPRRLWTSYENNNNPNQLMHTQHASTDWQGGADIRIGRTFGCNCCAVELGYWSVGGFSGSASQTHPSYVSSPLLFNDLEFAVGDPVADYFDSAEVHHLSRENELHNVELNLIQGISPCGAGNVWTNRLLVGVRYFKFDEDLIFSTLDQGGTWGANGGLDEVYLRSSTSNDLTGVQLGCSCERQIGCRTRFFATPKFGVYNNRIEHYFDLRRGDGTAAMPSAASGVAGGYPVEARDDVVAFLSEINLGLQHQLNCRWSLIGGYRVVVLNNLGLADNQIPQYIIDIPELLDVDTDASLVLHGAFFGATRVF